MDHETFVNRLTKPIYVWRMARGVVPFVGANDAHPLVKSGRTRMARAQAEMDELVLERAAAIRAERGES